MVPHQEYRQTILRGLEILAKYDPILECSFEHDRMWVADFEATAAKMTPEEIATMAKYGWHRNEESWSHY